MRFRILLTVIAAGTLLALVTTPAHAATGGTDAKMDAVMASIDADSIAYRDFFTHFPKGADLHQHLSGAVWAESMLSWAAQDGLCLTPVTFVATTPPCSSDQVNASRILTSPLQPQVIAAWSMRLFIPSLTQSGHDHFFDAFGKYANVLTPVNRRGGALAEALNQVAADSVVRVEMKASPYMPDQPTLLAAMASEAPGAVSDPARFPEALAALRAAGLDAQAKTSIAITNAVLAAKDAALGCGTPTQQPGCDVSLGLVAEVNRNAPQDRVFSQMAMNFAAAAQDTRWVAIDLVSVEDGLIALSDYSLQMQMVRFMRSQYPGVHVTLHAGELVPGLVPPADMTSHIRQAVEVAGAERIGHGVSIRSERDAQQLMREMSRRGVLVEVALTSNEQILGTKAKQSQLPVYLANDVAVSLATDDPGIERTDLSEQYMKARRWFHLSYADLKKISYNGITYSFATPELKAVLKARLDRAFSSFEARYAH